MQEGLVKDSVLCHKHSGCNVQCLKHHGTLVRRQLQWPGTKIMLLETKMDPRGKITASKIGKT